MEGLGTHFTVDMEVEYEWDPWSMVIQWIKAALGTWMFTGTKVPRAAEPGLQIARAAASLGDGPIFGHVDLPDIFVPHGFSGAVSMAGRRTLAGRPILQTIAVHFIADFF